MIQLHIDEKQKIPGEKIAQIEEYLPGENTYEDNDVIRSTVIGDVHLDTTERLASINRQKQITVPNVGDIIIGVVEANLPSMIAIMLKYVNGKKVVADLECICVTRHIRKKNIALAKDVVKGVAKGTSNLAGAVKEKRTLEHLSNQKDKLIVPVKQTLEVVKTIDNCIENSSFYNV